MHTSELLIINTIGNTGAEIVSSFLGRMPNVDMLPGTNFMWFNHCLYRKIDVRDQDPESLFAIFTRRYNEKDGRFWAGLHRFMTANEIKDYKFSEHKELFLERYRQLHAGFQFLDVARIFAETYFLTLSGSVAPWIAFCGKNFAINLTDDEIENDQSRWIHVKNRIETWLAMISRRLTWDPIASIKFYIVHNLYLLYKQKKNPGYEMRCLDLYLEDLVFSQEASLDCVRKFLNLSPEKLKEHGPGTLEYDKSIVLDIFSTAKQILNVYSQLPLFQIAQSLETWGPQFLESPDRLELLEKFESYWNSTAQTNFDAIGPLEEHIVTEAFALLGAPLTSLAPCPNHGYGAYFYSYYFKVSSHLYDSPECLLNHSLGTLENEIELPLTPFFIRCVVSYYKKICSLHEKNPHSYRPIREESLYRRLTTPEALERIRSIRLMPLIEQLEETIDAAEVSVLKRDLLHTHYEKKTQGAHL